MENDWEYRDLDQVAVFENRIRIPLSAAERAARPGDIPYWGAAGPFDTVDDFLFEGARVLVAEDGNTVVRPDGRGTVHWADGRYWVNNHAHVLDVRAGQDLKWLYYVLLQAQVRELVTGSAQPKLSMGSLKRLSLRVPPGPEQRAIAQVLSTLDEKIQSDRRLADVAEALWLAAVANTLRNARRVPVANLIATGALVVNDGYRAKNSELADTGIPFLRAGNLTADGLVLEDADLVPPDVVTRAGIKVAHAWDTAFTSKGTVGRITLVGPEPEPFVYSPQVCFWRSIRGEVLSPLVLHAWMRSPRFIAQVDSVKGQTDMADYVSLRDQRAMVIDLPSERAQRQAEIVAEPMATMAWGLRREARTLAAIRDVLLPKLVSGQIRVPFSEDPEEMVAVALEAHQAGRAA